MKPLREKKLTKTQQAKIKLYLLKGYSFQEIADMYNISLGKLQQYNRFQQEKDLKTVFVNLGSKKESYYKNENDYGKIPKYNFDELGNDEKSLLNE